MYEINEQAFAEFDEHRQSSAKLRKGWTELAKKKARNLLSKLSTEDQQLVVDNSIIGGYSGLFPACMPKSHARPSESAFKPRSAIEACRHPDQLARLCQDSGIGLPPPGMDFKGAKVWAVRKLEVRH